MSGSIDPFGSGEHGTLRGARQEGRNMRRVLLHMEQGQCPIVALPSSTAPPERRFPFHNGDLKEDSTHVPSLVVPGTRACAFTGSIELG